MTEPLLLAAAPLATFDGQRLLTRASGFFFQRDERLYLVSSRHVFIDEPQGHLPDRIEIELHTDALNLTLAARLSVPLYRHGLADWRQARDSGGDIDVAVIELERPALPPTAVMNVFTPAHLQASLDEVEVGTPLLIAGFPLGFHDTLHHLPVVRQAIVASAFGVRFQGQGFFLTDARTHRGTSGAAVVMRDTSATADPALPWKLLGVHSGRMDMQPRDEAADDFLGLNCAWYADVLMTLTDATARSATALPAPTDKLSDPRRDQGKP
jgi:Trypsin-like peptidase domain